MPGERGEHTGTEEQPPLDADEGEPDIEAFGPEPEDDGDGSGEDLRGTAPGSSGR